jgi:hypothetical protein
MADRPRPVNPVHSRTLRRALQTVGTKERLAIALNLPIADLEAYMGGKETVPNRVFMAALDIVAHRSTQAGTLTGLRLRRRS